jgi:hypothetical protein
LSPVYHRFHVIPVWRPVPDSLNERKINERQPSFNKAYLSLLVPLPLQTCIHAV